MKKDKLREKYEKMFYSKDGHSKDNPQDVAAFEKKLAYVKKICLKQKITAAVFAVILAASGVITTKYLNETLDFNEPVYSERTAHEPDYFNKNPINVYIDKNDFGEKQLKTIKHILETIDANCFGFRFNYLEEYDEDSCNLYFHTSSIENDFGSVYLGITISSLMTNCYSEVVIEEHFAKLNTKMFENVVTHETLHALGLDHTKDISNIMFPFVLYNNISNKEYNTLNMLYPTTTNEYATINKDGEIIFSPNLEK